MVSNVVETNRKMMIVRLGRIYPFEPQCLMAMSEACQLLLEVCNIGEDGATYLLDDAWNSCTEMTNHPMVLKCKLEDTNYKQTYARITTLVRDSYTENQMILRKGINSFSETSQ